MFWLIFFIFRVIFGQICNQLHANDNRLDNASLVQQFILSYNKVVILPPDKIP